MLLHKKIPESQTDPEDGYILLAVLILVFFLLLSLSIAAPRVAKEIQRDKEQEAVERGLQYQRAIKLYYKKFGSYPTDVKQLEKTNDIRFLRRTQWNDDHALEDPDNNQSPGNRQGSDNQHQNDRALSI